MARLVWSEGQSIPSTWQQPAQRAGSPCLGAQRSSGGGPKGPPSAPPTIPPIIITPFSYQVPAPAIDPRTKPPKPPLVQHRPCISC